MTAGGGSRSATRPDAGVEVVAGPVSATIENGMLRWLSVDGVEVVRGIYGAVRDRQWGTVRPRFVRYDLDRRGHSFSLSLTAIAQQEGDEIDFVWQGLLTGAEDGTIRFEFDGLARRSFLRARIGLCVLHPARLAGARLDVTTPWGAVRGRFPDEVVAISPFSNITDLLQEPGTRLETHIALAGDLFEMEDQRGFGDASFKTFSTPLSLPQPVRIDAGTHVLQSVTIEPLGARRHAPVGTARRRHETAVVVGDPVGSVPSIGVCAPTVETRVDQPILDAFASLRLAHLRVDVPLANHDWRERLDRAVAQAAALGTALDVAIVGRVSDTAFHDALEALDGRAMARLHFYDPERHTSPPHGLRWLREAADAARIHAAVGGGSRAYFWHLALDGIDPALADFVAFPVAPQVHAFDDASIAESIEALTPLARSAARLAAHRPLVVGPLTLRPLFNPDLVGPPRSAPAGELPPQYDARQTGMLAAAWTLGAFGALASEGVSSLTMHELAGRGGLVAAAQPTLPRAFDPPGTPYPAFHVLASLAGAVSASLRATSAPPGVAAVAVGGGGAALQLILANLSPSDRTVSVRVPAGRETGSAIASRLVPPMSRLGSDGGWSTPEPLGDGMSEVRLGAYGVVRIEVPGGQIPARRGVVPS